MGKAKAAEIFNSYGDKVTPEAPAEHDIHMSTRSRRRAFKFSGCTTFSGMFADGFESGDTSAWTVSMP